MKEQKFTLNNFKKAILGTALVFGTITINAQHTPSFVAPIDNPFGLEAQEVFQIHPNLVDIDNDGDLDLLAGSSDGNTSPRTFYQENTGSITSPVFGTVTENPFNSPSNNGTMQRLTFCDIDGDGDQDLFRTAYVDAVIQFYENIGTADAPNFSTTPVNAPFNIQEEIYVNNPAITFADIDGDGDFDFFYGGQSGEIYMEENIGTATSPDFGDTETGALGITAPVLSNSVPTFGDMDNDGDLDLLIGGHSQNDNEGYLNYYENTGTVTAPDFGQAVTNPYGITGVRSNPVPALLDLDNDGDLDILVGETDGANPSGFYYYENTVLSSSSKYTLEAKMEITPNPASENITINIKTDNALNTTLELSLLNLLGQKLKTQTVQIGGNTFTTSWDIQHLAKGVYSLNIKSGEKQLTRKVIIR